MEGGGGAWSERGGHCLSTGPGQLVSGESLTYPPADNLKN